MRQVVERQIGGRPVASRPERSHRARFRLLYYLTLFLVATMIAGVLQLASLLE